MKRITALILTLAMLCIAMASCATDDPDKPAETTPAPSDLTSVIDSEQTVTDTVVTTAGTGIEAVDYGGKTFTVVNLDNTITANYPYAEIHADPSDSSTVNDAVYRRNMMLNKKYNIELESFRPGERDAVSEKVKMLNATNDDTFDLVMQTLSHSVALAASGQVVNYDQLPHVNLSADWWFKDVLDQISIANQIYYAPCYANICFMSGTSLMLFNKQIAKVYSIDDVYSLVSTGKWTYGKFVEYAESVTTPKDSYTDDDLLGFRGQQMVWGQFFNGMGGMLIAKNSDDLPYYDVDSRELDLLREIVSMVNNKKMSCYGHYEKVVRPTFINGKTLFLVTCAYDIEVLRNYDVSFGIIPIPKYDENQKKYISTIHQDWSSVMLVPSVQKDSDNLDMIGRVLEDMAYYSLEVIKPAYYDVLLQSKFANDPESAETLDLLYDYITVDLALVFKKYNITIDTEMRNAVINNNVNVTSTLTALSERIDYILKSIIKDFTE